jgi:hypothetical protein
MPKLRASAVAQFALFSSSPKTKKTIPSAPNARRHYTKPTSP